MQENHISRCKCGSWVFDNLCITCLTIEINSKGDAMNKHLTEKAIENIEVLANRGKEKV
jgi:hypothetical protein